jgi:FkbH-like protein
MLTFTELKKNLKKDYSLFSPIRIALLSDSSSQLFVQAIKGYAYEICLRTEIYEADYDQIKIQCFNVDSELYKFNADFTIIFHSTQKLLNSFYSSDINKKKNFAQEHIEYVEDLINNVSNSSSSKIIYFNFSELDDGVFGNFSNKTELSFAYQLRQINFELMNLSRKYKNFFINDLSALHNRLGTTLVYDTKIYINTDIIFSIDFLPIIAKNTLDIIQSLLGKFKKCLILDLDNTIWGGIIGDDGIENIQIGDLGIGKAFTEFQLWVKQLKERGVVIAICSKNNENIAKEPFEKHPEMILKLEDISVFVANWETKVDNIRYIQSVLNIGFDSIVFIDDSAFERDMIRTNLSEIIVPELPEDPAEYLSYLRTLNLFETNSFTEEDTIRTKQYQEEAARIVLQKTYSNEGDFLESLQMVSVVSSFNRFNTPRVAQLTQRSNQFNLRTKRYTEVDILRISNDINFDTLSFTLEDKYGDYGLISLVILEKRNKTLFIDTWLMSCRVLKRGMENFVLNEIIRIAKKLGIEKIIGEYISTKKNEIVKEHYKNLNFTKNNNTWELSVLKYKEKKVYIQLKKKINL